MFLASVVLDPIFDEQGKHVGFAKITRDITERKKAQDELEEARTSLFQSQKLQALGELTGGIAHDFNNLMTVVARLGGLPAAKARPAGRQTQAISRSHCSRRPNARRC